MYSFLPFSMNEKWKIQFKVLSAEQYERQCIRWNSVWWNHSYKRNHEIFFIIILFWKINKDALSVPLFRSQLCARIIFPILVPNKLSDQCKSVYFCQTSFKNTKNLDLACTSGLAIHFVDVLLYILDGLDRLYRIWCTVTGLP